MTELELQPVAPQNPEKLNPAKISPAKSVHRHVKPTNTRRLSRNLAVVAISTGLIATIALPAYASTQAPVAASADTNASTAEHSFVEQNAQSLVVAPAVAVTAAARDGYTATAAPKPVVVAAAPTARAAGGGAVGGNAGLPPFSLDGIVADGKQYIGTPYVYAGATPAGFDCSGFVLFLYSHVGIHLAHNARIQGESGTVVSAANARPGDLVIFNGGAHDGIYVGNHQVMDAPKPGGFVSIRDIWTTDVFYVRL